MFFIFGFGSQTSKKYGSMPEQLCGRCRNQVARPITKVTSWFSLFFIPLIPYKSRYMLICPICSDDREVDRFEFDEILRNINPEAHGGGSSGGKTMGGSGSGWGAPASQGGKPTSDAEKYAGKNAQQIAFLKKMEAAERAATEKD